MFWKEGRTPDDHWTTENVRTITNMLVVFAGVAAVVLLAVVAVDILGSKNKEATVAVTTSALGIISAVVSAYFGIRAVANTAAKASAVSTEKAGQTAVAQYELRVKKGKVDKYNDEIDELEKAKEITPATAKKLREASIKGEEEARLNDPMDGGG